MCKVVDLMFIYIGNWDEFVQSTKFNGKMEYLKWGNFASKIVSHLYFPYTYIENLVLFYSCKVFWASDSCGQSLSVVQGWSRALKVCTKNTINASTQVTDMGYAITLKITDINFSDLVQIHFVFFCQSGLPKPTRQLPLNKEKTGMALYDVPLVLYSPSFQAMSFFVCGRREMAVICHRIICLVTLNLLYRISMNKK